MMGRGRPRAVPAVPAPAIFSQAPHATLESSRNSTHDIITARIVLVWHYWRIDHRETTITRLIMQSKHGEVCQHIPCGGLCLKHASNHMVPAAAKTARFALRASARTEHLSLFVAAPDTFDIKLFPRGTTNRQPESFK